MKKSEKQVQKQVSNVNEMRLAEKQETPKVRQPWTWAEVVCLVLIALVGAYVAIRAARLEMGGDEWGFWEDSLKPGLEAILTFQHQDPQSHFLLELLSLPFMHLWPGDTLTGIRIPSVLAFFVYAWVGWRLGRRLKRSWLRLVLILGWFGNALVLEYFSLVRGYSLLLAFAALAYIGVIEAYDRRGGLSRQRLWSYIAILGAAAAMLAIMVFVFGFCVIAGALILRYGLDAKATPNTGGGGEGRVGWRQRLCAAWSQSGFIFATGLAVGVFYMPRYLILKDHPAMQWGGGSGFIHDTMASLVDTFPHYLPNALTPYLPMIAWAVTGLMALNAVAVGICLWRGQKRTVRDYLESPTILMSVLFAGIWVLSGVGHAVAGVQYLVQRTTFFLWPLIVAQCVFAMDESEGVWKWVVRGLNMLALAVALVVAGRSVNLDHGWANASMAHESEIVQEIAKLGEEAHGRPVVVAMTDWMKYTFSYYMEKTCGIKESPQTIGNPVFKMYGSNIYIYSMNYALPDDAEWHWHPATTHYLVAEIYGHQPEPTLMDTNPIVYWQGMRVGLYRALPQEKPRGCEPGKCGICQYFREMTGSQQKQ